MGKPPQDRALSTRSPTSTTTSRERFEAFLRKMADEGVSQQELARRTGIAAQHICDIKRGRRRLGVRTALRLEERFGISRHWFLGQEPAEEPSAESVPAPGAWARSGRQGAEAAHVVRLPVHVEPVEGDPYEPSCWAGSVIELTGPAAVAARRASRPYVLRLPADDHQGRLRQGDMLLVVQAADQTSIGGLGVIRSGQSVLLAWRDSAREWSTLATGEPIASEGDVGHCAALIWALLHERWPAGERRQSSPSAGPLRDFTPGKRPPRRILDPSKLKKPQ